MSIFNPTDANMNKIRNTMNQIRYNQLCFILDEILNTKRNINKNINSYGIKYIVEEYMKSRGINDYYNIDQIFVCLYDTFIDLKYKQECKSKRNTNINYLFNINVKKPYKI